MNQNSGTKIKSNVSLGILWHFLIHWNNHFILPQSKLLNNATDVLTAKVAQLLCTYL